MEGFDGIDDPVRVGLEGAMRAPRKRIDPRTGKVMLLHDAAFWREHEARRQDAGQSINQYCKARGLALSTFRRWSTRFRAEKAGAVSTGSAKQPGAAFLKVPIHRSTPLHTPARVEVVLGAQLGVKLEGEAATRVIALVMRRLGAPA